MENSFFANLNFWSSLTCSELFALMSWGTTVLLLANPVVVAPLERGHHDEDPSTSWLKWLNSSEIELTLCGFCFTNSIYLFQLQIRTERKLTDGGFSQEKLNNINLLSLSAESEVLRAMWADRGSAESVHITLP